MNTYIIVKNDEIQGDGQIAVIAFVESSKQAAMAKADAYFADWELSDNVTTRVYEVPFGSSDIVYITVSQ